MDDLVSVIVPVYNSENTLTVCIESILLQSYSNIEVLAIDDASNDSSWEILESFENHPRIKVARLLNNEGVAVARNLGISMSNGRYWAFCDSDDFWHREKIEKQLLSMKATNSPISFTSYWIVDALGQKLSIRLAPKSVDHKDLLLFNGMGCSTVLIDSKQTGIIEFPNYRKRQDWMLWLSLSKSMRQTFHSVQEPLAYYRKSANSLSSNKKTLIKHNYRVYREFLGFPIVFSVVMIIKFLCYHLIRKVKI